MASLRAVLLLAVVVGIWPSAARAQERLQWAWSGPEPCPSGAEVRVEILRLLGGELPPGPAIEVTAEARAAPSGYALRLRTEADGRSGERELTARRCDDLAAATALIVALMIDPEAAQETHAADAALADPNMRDAPVSASSRLGDPSLARARDVALEPPAEAPGGEAAGRAAPSEGDPSSGEAATEDASTPREAAAPSEVPRERESARPEARPPATPPSPERTTLGLSGSLDLGTLPAASPGLAVSVGRDLPPGSLRVRLEGFLEQNEAPDAPVGSRAGIFAFSGAVGGCLQVGDRWFDVGPCADLLLGALYGRSSGVSGPGRRAGFWSAAEAVARLRVRPLPWLTVNAEAGVAVSLVRPTFEIAGLPGGPDVFTPSPVSARVRLGLEAHFR